MSVWKKASKANQKSHRERHQLESRKHLGILEKKKDYKNRASDYNEKKRTVKLLRKRALNKNEDEFYHHMINSKLEDGVHFDKETESEDTPEQIRLMKSQDLRYISTRQTQEHKKIQKLQAQLHFFGVNMKEQYNKHTYFDENLDDSYKNQESVDNVLQILPNFNVKDLRRGVEGKKTVYRELEKRISREKELSVIKRKLEMKKYLQEKTLLKPTKIKKGTKTAAPVYKWKFERKK